MDKVLKQRLVGASILIALAVIFVPMFFEGESEPRSQRELELELPERPADAGREVRRLPLDPDEARRAPPESVVDTPQSDAESSNADEEAAGADADPSTDAGVEDARGGSADRSDPGEAQPREDESANEEQPATSDEGAETDAGRETESVAVPDEESEGGGEVAEGDWMVQVAVFSKRESADHVASQLDGLGHRPMVDVLVRDQAELYRLRVGPHASRAAAERAREQIVATVTGVEPVVLARNDDSPGAPPGSGFSVQVGSFASRNNAERLIDRLQEHGHEGFMHAEESGGRTIWRVRAGLFDERDAAEQLLETLRSEAGLDGIVVSHP